MQETSRIVAFVLLAFITSTILTSGIWLTAYFVGVKPNNGCKNDDSSKTIDADSGPKCEQSCQYELVESMPIGLYEGTSVLRFNSTADSWKKLMGLAKESVYITAFYWSLLANDTGDNFKWDDSALTVNSYFVCYFVFQGTTNL